MTVEFAEEERMLIELVEKFVENELMPLEKAVMAREAAGEPWALLPEEEAPLLEKCKELGLWALDAPEEVGGANLPTTVMLAVQERLKREFDLSLILSAPSVLYRVHGKQGVVTEVDNPSNWPDPTEIELVEEPFIKAYIG